MISALLLAGTIYVANRTCPQHPSIAGGSCIHTSVCGTTSNPCCTLEEGIRSANAASGTDAIEIHDLTGSTETVGAVRADGSAWPSFHGTAMYVELTSVATIAVASGDAYTLDLGNVLSNGILFGTASTASTIGGFTMQNKKASGDSTTWSGRNPYLYITGTSVVVDGMTLLDDNFDSVLSANVAIRFCSDDRTTCSGGIVRNSVISGRYHTFVFMTGAMQSCSDAGFAFYNNSFIFIRNDTGSSSATLLILENTGCPITSGSPSNNIVFANNKADYTLITSASGKPDPRGFYYRETTTPLYIFNNRFRDPALQRGNVYFQDNVDHSGNGTYQQENVSYFYNTIVGSGTAFVGDDGSSKWPMCAGSASGSKGIHIVSNLFSGTNPVADLGAGCATAGNTFNQRSSNDTLNNNLCYASSSPSCVTLTGGVDITHTGNTQTTTNPNVTDSGTATSTSAPDTLRLQSGSNAIGACSNNPIGQGAGVCSVSAAGITFDCTKDIDGQQRPTTGTTADCGADQFTGSIPPAEGASALRRRIVRLGP